jgi:hypothetical protein
MFLEQFRGRRRGTTIALAARVARDPTDDTPLQSHERPGESMLNQLAQDIRYAARMLLEAPTLAAGRDSDAGPRNRREYRALHRCQHPVLGPLHPMVALRAG